MCRYCTNLVKAIDAYVLKADNNMKKRLKKEGYVDVDDTVEAASELEENVAGILKDQTEAFTSGLAAENVDLEKFYADEWPQIKAADMTHTMLADAFKTEFEKYMPQFVESYIRQTDSELTLEKMSDRTTDWISSWSKELGELMELNSKEDFERILLEAVDEGYSVDKVARMSLDSGVRDEYYKARRASLTEILRAHSVAGQEAITQSPAVDRKMWVHTGEQKTEPRENHVAMNGQIVAKNEPYTLDGADGVTYYPMYPRDTNLPAGESINCHCLSQPIVSDDVLGKSLEERKEMQRKAIEEDDGEWEKELDARNKAKAGINEETIKMDWLKAKDKEDQVKYLGSESRWALVESGVIKTDADLEKLFKYVKNSSGVEVRVRKTLQDLKEDGIMLINHKTLEHATVGTFSQLGNPKKPPSWENGGRPSGGGHSQRGIEAVEKQGFKVDITKTYKNGVRIGNIPEHVDKFRREGNQMSWFPKSWKDDDVLVAGTYVANNPETVTDLISREGIKSGERLTGYYNGVTVSVTRNLDNDITTIYPNVKQ